MDDVSTTAETTPETAAKILVLFLLRLNSINMASPAAAIAFAVLVPEYAMPRNIKITPPISINFTGHFFSFHAMMVNKIPQEAIIIP